MKFNSEAHRKRVMAEVARLRNRGYTGYSVALRKKVDVKPSDKIEVKETKLKNGNTSVMLIGHMRIDGKEHKIPRIIGQF